MASVALPDDGFFEDLVVSQYRRLVDQQQTYLDYTGGNLYATSQIERHHALLRDGVFGNPHSTNPTSTHTTKLVEQARQRVIDYFGAHDYFCIFTQNATGALQIVGENYPFGGNTHLLLLADNHNSVNGIREYCSGNGGAFSYSSIHYEDLMLDRAELEANLAAHPEATHKLFAMPAQSNVSGVKHDLGWIATAQAQGWDVLLDAAAFVPANRLDLRVVKPDFVPVSFYKIFGYPTGLGCLLVRKDKFEKLRKRWFAGGTVTLAAVRAPKHYLANAHERFENGTINYLDIPAISIGLDHIESIGIDKITARVRSLTVYLYNALLALRHANGAPVVQIFGPKDRAAHGGCLIMCFFGPNGERYDFEKVEALANSQGISIRSGCFCNPGIDEVTNCISTAELAGYFTSRDRGDPRDMIAFLGKMRGATRVSIGLATRRVDLDRFVAFADGLKSSPVFSAP